MKKLFFTSLICSLITTAAFAGQDKKMTKEERAKAAEKHEKMAACLRSDKPMNECHKEMKGCCGKSDEHSCSMKHDHEDKEDKKD